MISFTTASAAAEEPPVPSTRAAQIVDDDLGAAPGELQRVATAEAAARARDDDNLAIKPNGHECLLEYVEFRRGLLSEAAAEIQNPFAKPDWAAAI